MTTPAGWHDDPDGAASLRWWDGSSWTEHIWVEPDGSDPVAAAAIPEAAAARDRATADEAPTDRATADEAPTDRATADQAPTDRAEPDQAPTERDPTVTTSEDADETPAEGAWNDLAARPPGATAKELARRARRRSPAAWLFDARSGERSLRTAAKGEREVGRRLRKLEPGWLVLHSVPLGDDRSDIDHLVIGPAGVFSLNTKNLLGSRVRAHPVVVEVDGKETTYLRSAADDAQHASRLLSRACGFDVPVAAVLVVMAHRLTVIEQPPDVAVVGRRSIVSWLTSQPAQQSFDVASEIFECARRDSTWR